MQDLEIAFYLGVIMVGFAALAIAGFWTFKTRDVDLRNFCILYALFTLVLIVTVLQQYLSLNVEGYSAWDWYQISGVNQTLSFAVIVALIHFWAVAYGLPNNRVISIISLITMFISIGLIYSPIGATLNIAQQTIYFGVGYKVAIVWYVLSFTFAIGVGYRSIKQMWHTERRNFMLGLLIFASIGYAETLLNAPGSLSTSQATFGQSPGFLLSSIPYVLYGFFLVAYFLNYSLPTPVGLDQVSESFLTTYNITGREREIIQMVIQGKSNADIAEELVISLATVKTHLHNIYQKVGVDSRYDLLARVRYGK